jgi:BNR repeat-like domain
MKRCKRMTNRFSLTSAFVLLGWALSCNRAKEFSVELSTNPAAPGSISPNITETPDARVVLSWIEPGKDNLALRFSIRADHGWSTPQTVVARENFDKYAEAPSWVSMLPNGALIAVWAEELPTKEKWPGNYLYAAVSRDLGKSWSQPAVIHSDRSNSEHSFASLAVLDDNHANIVWLDARDYTAKHKYRLMSAVISSAGSVENEETIDDDVCTCCPTALARTPQGLIAAYRDHTSEEIRDIYSARKEGGHWQSPHPVHRDGWHINACPVNGPALASRGNEVVAAWFTGAEEPGAVRVAFSQDGGATFAPAITMDSPHAGHKPTGRPALTLLNSGEALISWIRHTQNGGELVAARLQAKNQSSSPLLVASGTTQALGYPRMQALGSKVLLSWGGAGETKEISTALITPR